MREGSGQATKGAWWMPWRREPKKDAASCEKPRVAASGRRSGDIRMGQPTAGNAAVSADEPIVRRGQPGELKHLSTPREKTSTEIPLVVASERGGAQTVPVEKATTVAGAGLWGRVGRARRPAGELQNVRLAEVTWKGPP